MTQASPVTTARTEGPQGRPARPSEAYGLIAALASRAASRGEYYADALGCIARPFQSPYAELEVCLPTQTIHETHHQGPTDPSFWRPTVHGVLRQSIEQGANLVKLFRSRQGGARIAVLTALLTDGDGAAAGATAMVVECRSQDHARQLHAVMVSLVELTARCAGFVRENRHKDRGSNPQSADVIGRAAAYRNAEELAFALTNNLRNRLGCEQVALGQVRGAEVDVLSISGFDEAKSRSPGVAMIREAMEECLDHGQPIVQQRSGAWTDEAGSGFLLHKRWHQAVNAASIASIPLREGDSIVAILSLRRAAGEPFSRGELDAITQRVDPYGAAIGLVGRAGRSLPRHAGDSVRSVAARLLKPGAWKTKVVAVVGVLLACWLAFGRLDYRVTAPCEVGPASARTLAAPFEGRLAHAPHTAGQRVNAGDLLVAFDTTELELERERLTAEIRLAEGEADKARGENKIPEATLAEIEADRLRAAVAVLDGKIENARIIAPFDGTLIRGDLRQRIGETMPMGEPLLELADDSGYVVRARVEDARIAGIAPDLTGQFASHARPDRRQQFRVRRVQAAAEVHGGRNAFIVEADLSDPPDWLQPGMGGVARIALGTRPVWWVLSHRVIDFLRMKLWL